MHRRARRCALRRRVFYFHGFDPASTARYQRIFAAASERFRVAIAPLEDGTDGWQATRDACNAQVRYLRYEDLVRTYQSGGLLARLGRGIRTLLGYAAEGALGALTLRTVVLMLAPYLTAFAPVLGIALLSNNSTALAVAVGFGLVLATYFLLARYRVILVCDLFAYMRELAQGTGPAHEAHSARLGELSGHIAWDDADETLVIGHSLGGIAAIRAVADTLERLPAGKSLGLLTLGSVHGIVLAQKGGGRDLLATAIAQICADPRVFWVDVSSPRDAFCVPLTDPLLLIGDLARDHMISPKLISAQLKRAPAIPGDRRTVFPAMRRHMGYLLAPIEGSGFDYADTVTGPQDLRTRFGARNNSPKARLWRG